MKCPICNKVAIDKFKPFCSERCKILDLGKWLNGSYTIPTEESGEEEPN